MKLITTHSNFFYSFLYSAPIKCIKKDKLKVFHIGMATLGQTGSGGTKGPNPRGCMSQTAIKMYPHWITLRARKSDE